MEIPKKLKNYEYGADKLSVPELIEKIREIYKRFCPDKLNNEIFFDFEIMMELLCESCNWRSYTDLYIQDKFHEYIKEYTIRQLAEDSCYLIPEVPESSLIDCIINKDKNLEYNPIGKNIIYFNGNDKVYDIEGYIISFNGDEIIFDLNDLLDGKINQYKKTHATILFNKERKFFPYEIYDELVERSILFEKDTSDQAIKSVLSILGES